MPKYLVQGSYTVEGMKGLLKSGGSARRAVVSEMLERVDGRLEAYYFAFGENDFFVIADVPDNVTAAALSMTVAAAGAATSKTTVLLTPEEIDQVTKKQIMYRPPGQ